MTRTELLRSARERYERDRPEYERLATETCEQLRQACYRAGVIAEFSCRAKGVASLVKKLIVRPRETYETIEDKAGVRAIPTYADMVPTIVTVARSEFAVFDEKDLGAKLAKEDRSGYAGRHLFARPKGASAKGAPYVEIQIHTLGQSLWAKTNHDFIYKGNDGDIPIPVRRANHRLSAVCEIADEQAMIMRREMASLPGQDVQPILAILEQSFYRLAAQPYNRELSVSVLASVKSMVSPDDFMTEFVAFVAGNDDKLRHVFDTYSTPAEPLVSQPESLLIFFLLERDRFRLRDDWPRDLLPLSLLESMAGIWGIALPDDPE